jgi:hypothetical protein
MQSVEELRGSQDSQLQLLQLLRNNSNSQRVRGRTRGVVGATAAAACCCSVAIMCSARFTRSAMLVMACSCSLRPSSSFSANSLHCG